MHAQNGATANDKTCLEKHLKNEAEDANVEAKTMNRIQNQGILENDKQNEAEVENDRTQMERGCEHIQSI